MEVVEFRVWGLRVLHLGFSVQGFGMFFLCRNAVLDLGFECGMHLGFSVQGFGMFFLCRNAVLDLGFECGMPWPCAFSVFFRVLIVFL